MTSQALSPSQPAAPRGNVLLVDDERTVLWVLKTMLLKLGYHVDTAANGRTALQRLKQDLPDIIVVDRLMPGMDGVTFSRRIRENPRTSMIPLIMISSQSKFDQRMEGLQAGVDDYIAKPFNMMEVRTRMEHLLRRYRLVMACNPLTQLPGNLSIETDVQRRLAANRPFAFAYIDIDHFKAYNDAYGFESGDRAIRALARLISALSGPAENRLFVGHVGGDDFVWIGEPERIADRMPALLKRFDRMAERLYSAADRRRHGVRALDRRHEVRHFPLMALSCAVVDTRARAVRDYAGLVRMVRAIKEDLKSDGRRRASAAVWNWPRGRETP